ncbi:hypothetical protein SEEM710_12583, partial [Salmonella enterica subsp. enterica serovar Montevideo str. ATCC BAA710]
IPKLVLLLSLKVQMGAKVAYDAPHADMECDSRA